MIEIGNDRNIAMAVWKYVVIIAMVLIFCLLALWPEEEIQNTLPVAEVTAQDVQEKFWQVEQYTKWINSGETASPSSEMLNLMDDFFNLLVDYYVTQEGLPIGEARDMSYKMIGEFIQILTMGGEMEFSGQRVVGDHGKLLVQAE